MPLNDSAVDYVSMTFLGTDMLSYFQKPVLNEAKDVIVITPKSTELTAFIESQKQGFVDILISLEEGISADIEGQTVFLKQSDNPSFSFRYANVTETTSPTPVNFFLSRDYMSPDKDLSSVNNFYARTEIDLDSNNYEELTPQILTNMAGKYVDLYGTFWDDASGVAKISVYEHFKGSLSTSDASYGYIKTADYYSTSQGAEFFTDANNYTTFCIKHELKSDDGAVCLKVEASDLCDNTAFSEEAICFKKTTINFATNQGGVFIGNLPYKYENGTAVRPKTAEEVSQNLKTIYYEDYVGDGEWTFKYVLIPEQFYTVVCEYNGDPRKMTPKGNLCWAIKLQDDEKISGSHLKFIISDILGNTGIKEYQIPESEDYIGVPVEVTNDTANISFLYKTGEVVEAPAYIKKTATDTEYAFDNNEYDDYVLQIQKDYDYLVIPHCGFEWAGMPRVEFYTEVVKASVYSVASLKTSNVNAVILKNYDNSGKPYKISKSSLYAQNDIKVQIADDSWSNDNGYDNIILYVKDKAFNMGQWNNNTNAYDWIQEGDGAVNFTKGQTECTISVLSHEMFQSATELFVFGQKGAHYSTGASIIIPKLSNTDLAYDNVLIGRSNDNGYGWIVNGYAYAGSTSINESVCDYSKETDCFTITLTDLQTGVSTNCKIIEVADFYEKYGKDISTPADLDSVLTTLSSKGYNPNVFAVTSSNTITFPRWLLSKGYSYFYFDNAGNLSSGNNNGNRYSANVFVSKFSVDASKASFYIKRRENAEPTFPTGDSYQLKSVIYSWNNNSWEYKNEKADVKDYLDTNFPYSLTASTDYQTDRFIKVGLHYNGYNSICSPVIFYGGTDRNSTDYDYMYPPSSNNNILIQSDAPVFVQTVVTDVSYEECKNWDAGEWLYDNCRKIVKEQQMDFKSNEHDPKIYKIFADGQYNAYNDTCYVVLAHLADGTVMMSDVKQF